MKKIYLISISRKPMATLVSVFLALTANAQTKIGELYYTLNDEQHTATLTRSGDYATISSITIPEKVAYEGIDYTVTAIGQQAFQSCTELKTIEFPSTLTKIDKWAFYGCSGLTSIELPEGLTELVTYAFQKCTGLESVKFNDKLTVIGASAFTNCTSLKEVVLPQELLTIETGAFNFCESLTKVIFGPKVENIEQNAFYSCGLTEFTFPSSLKTFGGGILSQNKKLTTVTFDACMKSTGEQTVRECTALTTVNIPEGIDNIGNGTFYGCSAIEEIKLPATLTSLSSNSFYGCSALKSIDLPAAITEIPSAAFYNCTGLQTLPGGNNITKIDKQAFYGCSSLTEISLSDKLKVLPSHCFDRCTRLSNVIIPESVIEFEDSPFHYCTSLTTLNIPASVASMPGNPAIGAENLEAYNVADGNPSYASVDGVLYNKEVSAIIAFPGAKTAYDMPETVTEITDFALNALPNLTRITFSKNLKTIGQSALYGTKLNSVDLSETKVDFIGMTAFFMVNTITEFIFPNNDFTLGSTCLGGIGVSTLVFPESVTSIGVQNETAASVFSSGSNIKSIWLPSTLQQIVPFGGYSSKLQTIYSWATTPPEFVGGNPVELPAGTTIKVRKGTKQAYEDAWKDAYTNATYDDCLPQEPTIEVTADNIKLQWETYTDQIYPAEINRYELTLMNNTGVIETKVLNNAGEENAADATKTPEVISVTINKPDAGNHTVSIKGFTVKNQLVMNFKQSFEVTESGIDEISSKTNAKAEYYDLSGRKVLAPQKGKLYIIRTPGQTKGAAALKI